MFEEKRFSPSRSCSSIWTLAESAFANTKNRKKNHGAPSKRGSAASELFEADDKAGGARKRAGRRRTEKEPEVPARDDADVACGAGSINGKGSIGGKSCFSGENQETYHTRKSVEKARFEDGESLYRRNDLTMHMRGNKKAINREQLEDSLERSPLGGRGAIERGINDFQTNTGMGLESRESSPMGWKAYRGPLFSEVEKSLKHTIGSSEGKKGPDTSLVTWRRVECEDIGKMGDQKQTQVTIGQKRAFSGEVTNGGPARKGQKFGFVAEKIKGKIRFSPLNYQPFTF
jgi:hypothetical protein